MLAQVRVRLCVVPATECGSEHGWQSYSFRFTHYRYDVNGVLVGSNDITAALELAASGDEYTTIATSEIFDANHNLIGRGCTTHVREAV